MQLLFTNLFFLIEISGMILL